MKTKKPLITRDNFIIIASIMAAIAIFFFFQADTQMDKADFNLFKRAEILADIKFLMGESDNSMLLYKISDEEDTQELILSADKILKIENQIDTIGLLSSMYTEHKSSEKNYRYLGLSFIVLSIIFNAIALVKKK